MIGDKLGGFIRRKLGVQVSVPAAKPEPKAAPTPPPDLDESRDLAHCHPVLQRRYGRLKAEYEARTGKQLFETCTFRSRKKQAELHQIGRRGIPGEKPVTNADGVSSLSRHNAYPAEGLDVAVDLDPGPGRKVSWAAEDYALLGPLAADFGLVWGGDWKSIKDRPHLELPPGATEEAA